MTRTLTQLTLSIAALCLVASNAEAQVSASSFSNGGTAIATARGKGNTRLSANATALNGGYARADMRGSGRNGGFARGSSNAFSNGGVAISRGQSHANGWGAYSNANSNARTYQGFARSNARAVARGTWSNADANAGVSTFRRYGNSSAEAIDNRWNGYQQTYGSPAGQGYSAPASQTYTPASNYSQPSGQGTLFYQPRPRYRSW